MSDSKEWLDTETAAILAGTPPRRLAPAKVSDCSLVMLAEGDDPLRMTEADALIGQFDLICADCVSVFIQDEVESDGDSRYVADLYSCLLKSPEFKQVRVVVKSLPSDETAERFLSQFVSKSQGEKVFGGVMFRKKARIMQHWGAKIGATIHIEE